MKNKKGLKLKHTNIRVSDALEITNKQHGALVSYCKDRLDFAIQMRGNDINRYRYIDKEVAGYMQLDDDDKKRMQDNKRGFGPKVYDVNLPLVATQMDEAVTFFTTVFFPEEGPYNAVTNADKQEVAKGFSSLMNQHSTYYKHFTNFAKGSYAGLKYNLGLWEVNWRTTYGNELVNGTDNIGLEIKENQVVMQGNELKALDVYNTLLDPSIHPSDLHSDGEFFATVEQKTAFRVKLMQQTGEIFGIERLFGENGKAKPRNATSYYTQKPEIHGDSRDGSSTGTKTNWSSFMSGTANGSSKMDGSLEMVNINIWLPAKRFGLDEQDGYQIWRVTFLNMQVVAATRLTNAHGFLPMVATVPWDDEYGTEAKSYAEILLPYQRFASFEMNVHQRAARKALYNLTVYNSKLLPEMANADVLGGKVPMSGTAEDIDINKVVKQFSDVPDTSNTMRDVEAMDSLMQKILPTDILKQVSSLERATQYQAAATVQGANRRNLKIAKIVDTQAFSPARKMQMYNILQFQKQVEVLDDKGQTLTVDPSQMREAKLEFAISDGLRGLDKLILVETMKDILTLLVQNQQAAATFDISKLINYITTLIGDHTSFSQFEFQNEFDKLTPEQKQMAFQLLQQALQQQGADGSTGAAPAGQPQGVA